jgi:trigger factor
VKTEITPVAENEILLAVEVPQGDVQAGIESTIKRLGREASIPGFRKGKVPRQVLEQRLGEDYIMSETLNDALPNWYEAAVDEADIDPVSLPEIDFDGFNAGQDFAFTAKVQVRPEPRLGDYKGLSVPKRSAEVTEGQVDAQLALLQERLASLKPVEGRAAAGEDFAQIDFAGTVGGEPLEGAKAEDYMLQIGQGQLIPGFEEALVGMKAGESTSFEVTFPDDYHAEELRGKAATFTVTMKEIKEKVVPALDDDLAKEASEFETLAELRDDTRTRLERMQDAAVERDFRAAVVQAAVDNATVVVPSAMVDRQAHALYHELEETVGERGLEMDKYLLAIEKTEEEVEEELRPRAEAIVKQGLVLGAIRDAEQIEVSDEEVRERIKEDAALLQRDPNQLVIDIYASGRQTLIRDELVMAKTVDFLVENAVAVPVSDDAAATDEDAAEAPEGEEGD